MTKRIDFAADMGLSNRKVLDDVTSNGRLFHVFVLVVVVIIVLR